MTPEIRARVFALYWMQRVAVCFDTKHSQERVTRSNIELIDHLSLRRIDQLTDEELIKLADINEYFIDSKKYSKLTIGLLVIKAINTGDYLSEVPFTFSHIIASADYLRSIGVAVPYLDWSVEELEREGVFKFNDK